VLGEVQVLTPLQAQTHQPRRTPVLRALLLRFVSGVVQALDV
jgi:hypothetical protein